MPQQNQRNDGLEPGDVDIDKDTADFASDEDQGFDTLDEAIGALGDDEGLTDEQTDPEDGDLPSQTREPSGEDDETDDGADFDDGDGVLVMLGDGEQVPLGELKKGYFRNKDYTHKTESLAQERKAVEAMRDDYGQNAQSLQIAYQNLTHFLEGLIPSEPDLGLAQSDPATYQYQMALRNNAIAELRRVHAAGEQANATIQGASDDEIARFRSSEAAKLLEALPMLKDPGRKAAFEASVKKTALEFGFSEQEISSTADHRILQLVHYARIGKIAEQNRKNARRRITEKPRKGGRSTPVSDKPTKNREAMRRLAKTGSFEAAMAVDFD
jgi:pyruvate/2-oxoglutarate dehydrogenase complex dihydrolipoamide acyltransferase (E2) component